MATDLVLTDQLPPGWLDDKEEERYRLEVGDLVTLLSGALRKRWRFNLMTKKIELDGKPIPVFELENLYCHLSQRGYTISKDKAIDAAKAAAMAHSFHPVREYLERVASDDSIVAADLDQIATVFWDTNDPLYDAMLRKTLIGAVKRIYEPGCIFRTCLVFKGVQDIRKSSSFKYLASPDWVTDTAQDKHEDFLLALHGCWFYELAELDSITNKKDAGALKNDLSSPKDDIRVPYGRACDTTAVRALASAPPTETIFYAMKQGRLGSGLSIFRMMQKTGLSSTPTAYGITVMRSSRLLFLHTEPVNNRFYRLSTRTNPIDATLVLSATTHVRTTSLTFCITFHLISNRSPLKQR